MSHQLCGRTIAILAADGVERVELDLPRGALYGAGAAVEVLSDKHPAGTITVDRQVSDASVGNYDALLLPGGTVNPDTLRTNPDAIEFVRAFVDSGKPVASICHGPWTLAEADRVSGKRLTSWPSIRTDLRRAGAHVVDEEVCIDGQFITSRSPRDLPAFCAAIVEQFAHAPALAH
jgi:protease I